jgi:hypothetical protein
MRGARLVVTADLALASYSTSSLPALARRAGSPPYDNNMRARLYAEKAEALEERGMNGSLGSLATGAIAIALAIPNGSSMAQDRDRLEGWGPFKFSMSRAQAIETIKPNAYFYGSPFIGYDTEIDGAKWHAVVEFSDDQSVINKIRLQQGTIASLMTQSAPRKEIVTKEACLSRVGRLEPQLTKRYGTPDRTFDRSEIQDDNRHVSYDGAPDRFDHSSGPPIFTGTCVTTSKTGAA